MGNKSQDSNWGPFNSQSGAFHGTQGSRDLGLKITVLENKI